MYSHFRCEFLGVFVFVFFFGLLLVSFSLNGRNKIDESDFTKVEEA